MDVYKKSFTVPISAGSVLDDSPTLAFPNVKLARIATSDTLKVTLGMSRKESYWRLLHSRASSGDLAGGQQTPQLRSFSRVASLGDIGLSGDLFPGTTPNSPKVGFMLPSKSLPSDGDYHRMLDRLHKILSGSVFSVRAMVLSESKPLEITLERNEWQYLRVKTQGMAVPMKVVMKKEKGAVVVYLSKTVQEPKENLYDQIHTKDVILFSEPSCRFKHPWVFLGIHCVDDSSVSLSLHFGSKPKRHKAFTPHSSLADLDELRRDETKREELYKYVDTLLAMRHEHQDARLKSRNFIRENKKGVGKTVEEESLARREVEQNRREIAAKKKAEFLREKKRKAQLFMHRKQIKGEEEAKMRADAEAKKAQERAEKEWITMLSFCVGAEELWKHYCKKLEDLNWVRTQMRAAVILQRFYRRIGETVNPRKMCKQRALDSLTFFSRLVGPELFFTSRTKLFLSIKRDEESHRVHDAVISHHKKSNPHPVVLIQSMWRRYVQIKQDRLDLLSTRWSQAVHLLLPDPPTKKNIKRVKELEAKYQKIDHKAVLLAHLKACQRQYYKAIAAYVKANRAFRQGVKAFIFAKLKRGEAVCLSGAPDFRYMLSLEEMQKLVEERAG